MQLSRPWHWKLAKNPKSDQVYQTLTYIEIRKFAEQQFYLAFKIIQTLVKYSIDTCCFKLIGWLQWWPWINNFIKLLRYDFYSKPHVMLNVKQYSMFIEQQNMSNMNNYITGTSPVLWHCWLPNICIWPVKNLIPAIFKGCFRDPCKPSCEVWSDKGYKSIKCHTFDS